MLREEAGIFALGKAVVQEQHNALILLCPDDPPGGLKDLVHPGPAIGVVEACAVLGVVLLNVQNKYNFIESTVYGITGGLGFLLAIVLFASVRERVEFAEYPKSFEGFPICLVTASLLALAFMGFSGMKIF